MSYVKYAVSYWESVFMPKEYHDQRETKDLERENLVRQNLEGTQRLMMMIDKGISLGPADSSHNNSESVVLSKYNDFNYNKSLAPGGFTENRLDCDRSSGLGGAKSMAVCQNSPPVLDRKKHFLSESQPSEDLNCSVNHSMLSGVGVSEFGTGPGGPPKSMEERIQEMLKSNQEAIRDVDQILRK